MRHDGDSGRRKAVQPLRDPLREQDEDLLYLHEDDPLRRREAYLVRPGDAYPLKATLEKGTNTERTLATMGKDDYYDGEDESQWDLDTYRSKFKCIVGRLNERYNWSNLVRKQYAAVCTRNDEISAKYYKQTSVARSREQNAYDQTQYWIRKFNLLENDYDVAMQKIDHMRVVHKYMIGELHLNYGEISSLQKQLDRAETWERDERRAPPSERNNKMARNITPGPEIRGDSKTWTAFDSPITSRRSKKQNAATYEIEAELAVTSSGGRFTSAREIPLQNYAEQICNTPPVPSQRITHGHTTTFEIITEVGQRKNKFAIRKSPKTDEQTEVSSRTSPTEHATCPNDISHQQASNDMSRGEIAIEGAGNLTVVNDVRPSATTRRATSTSLIERTVTQKDSDQRVAPTTNVTFGDFIICSAMQTSTSGDKKDHGAVWYRKIGKYIRSVRTRKSSSTSKLPKIDQTNAPVLEKSRSSRSFSICKFSGPKIFRRKRKDL